MADIPGVPVAKACSSCAKAKAKCDISTAGKCSRCVRLVKECTPQQAVRKRKTPRTRRSDQIAQLQDQVNGLLSMVGSGQRAPEQAAVFIPSPASLASSTSQTISTPLDDDSPTYVLVPFLHNSDALLSIFRDRIAAQMPFVVIPSHMTAEELHREKPMVYMAVMLASSYRDVDIQIKVGNLLLKYLAMKVVLEGKKSFDILQGLLIFISCFQYVCHINYQANNLMGFMSAQLVELGLKRISAHNEVHESFMQIARRAHGHNVPDRGVRNCGKTLTMDEKRAFLGCYYLSSCLASCTSRLDCMTFPAYINDCCNDLMEAGEHLTDAYLVFLMKLQSLVEKQRLGGLWESVNVRGGECLSAPIGLQVRSHQLDLLNFKLSLPAGYLTNPLFSMNYYAAEICLYEVGFKFSPTTGVVRRSLESLGLTDILYACFEATRLWFEAYFSIPVVEYCSLSLINFGQLFHAIGALHKLSIFEIPEWDTTTVRTTLNMSSVISQIIIRLEEAEELYTGQSGVQNSPWTYCVDKLRHCKTWWELNVAEEANTPHSGEGWTERIDEDLLPFVDFGNLDDYFWQTMDRPPM